MTQTEFFAVNRQAVVNFLKVNMLGFEDLLEQHPHIANNDIEGWLVEGFENGENGYAHIEINSWLTHSKKPEVLDLSFTCSNYESLTKAIEVNDGDDDSQDDEFWANYTHKDIVKINVAHYCGNKKHPGDCWIANYYTQDGKTKFDASFATIAEFESLNGCFPKEIINIEYIEGIL